MLNNAIKCLCCGVLGTFQFQISILNCSSSISFLIEILICRHFTFSNVRISKKSNFDIPQTTNGNRNIYNTSLLQIYSSQQFLRGVQILSFQAFLEVPWKSSWIFSNKKRTMSTHLITVDMTVAPETPGSSINNNRKQIHERALCGTRRKSMCYGCAKRDMGNNPKLSVRFPEERPSWRGPGPRSALSLVILHTSNTPERRTLARAAEFALLEVLSACICMHRSMHMHMHP